jgi:flagellar hook-associated protein 1 FlgK
MQGFFDAMQVLADDPTSIPARQSLLSESQSMVDRFHGLDRQFSDKREQLNQALNAATTEINGVARSIAQMNKSIVEAIGASGDDEPNDLLDKRDVLLKALARQVDVSVVPQDDGAWNLFIGKGQPLVLGSDAATLSTQPGANDVGQLDVALTDLNGTHAITDQLTGGEISGLLSFRADILDPGQNRLGLVALGISDQLNRQHQLGMDLNDDLGGQMFNTPQLPVLANGNNTGSASATGTIVNTGALTASDYLLEAGAGGYTLTRLSDGQRWAYNSGDIRDGFSLNLTGTANGGDDFLVRPTRNGAEALTLQISDPRKFAAAGPLRAAPDAANRGNGTVSQPAVSDVSSLTTSTNITLTFDATLNQFNVDLGGGSTTTLSYNPDTDSGGRLTLPGHGNPAFSMTGTPADGDRFNIQFNTNGVGDNRNALLMAELQHAATLLGDGAGNETATFQETYGQLVSDVGSRTRHAGVNARATAGLLERHEMSLSSVNGVNLDEEAANLIRYQQAYQAAAQVISVARTLFDTLLGAVRG